MKKRLFTVLLAVCLVLALGTVSALAVDTLPAPVGDVITLGDNVVLSSTWNVTDDIVLDLNGYTLSAGNELIEGTGNYPLVRVRPGASLVIRDSRDNGKVFVNDKYMTGVNQKDGRSTKPATWCVYVDPTGEFTLESGTIENTNTASESIEVIRNYGTVNVNGGTIKGVTGIFNMSADRGIDEYDNETTVCNITGGNITGTTCTSQRVRNSGTYSIVEVKEGWSWGVVLYGPGVDKSGVADNDKVKINISGGTITAGQAFGTNASSGAYAGYTLNVTGGSIIGAGDEGTGMYLPAIGVNNISGGNITGAQGIRICAGELNITGGTITGTAVGNEEDLIAGGSGGTSGALVIGKASGGYIGDIIVNISENAVIQNNANGNEDDTYPAIVVSDKNMADTAQQTINNPNGTGSDAKFKYTDYRIGVNVEDVEVDGDIVRISNISGTDDEHTEDGGDTSLTIDSATVAGDVINQSKAGGVTVNNSTVNGVVTVADGTNGTVAVFDSNIGSKSDTGVILVNTAVGERDPITDTGNYVAVINGMGYTDLTSAIAAADSGDTIEIVDKCTVTKPVILPDNITIDGNGNSINYNGTTAGGTAIMAGSGNVISDVTINAGNASHAVQFYQETSGELNNITVNGGTGTCVLVNGSTGIEIRNCTLNPGSGAYAHIEYGMGSGVTTIPSVVVEDNRFVDNEVPQIWVDNATVTAIDNVTSGEQTASELRNIIMDNITNDGYSNVIVSVVLTPGTVTDVTSEGEEAQINIPDTYDIELIVGEGGEAKTNFSNASAGTTITVTVTPDEGYELDYITVDGERISGTTFKMPDHDVTVRVYFTDGTSALPFTDVSAGQWFYDAVAYVYTNGMMEGDSATTFNPDGTMTRAMFWAVLGRIDGATITGTNWVDQARDWAMAEGVSDGTDPNGLVTREQMVTMLWRYAVAKGYDVSIGESTNILSYADFGQISEYAIPAMQWGCGSGVITGVTDTTLVPQGTATRAQCAAIFMRFDQM